MATIDKLSNWNITFKPKGINEYRCLPIASPIRAGILEADLEADGSKNKEKKSETKKKGSDILLNAGMQREYPTIEAFLNDIDSANGKSLKARQFINEACHLQDTVLAMVCQIDRELAARCTQYKENALPNIKSKMSNKNKNKTKNLCD